MGLLDAPAQSQILGSSKLQTFRAALGNRNFGPCNILTITDSIGEGTGTTNVEDRWTSRFRDGLRSRYPQAAAGGRGYVALQYAGTGYTQPVTLSGGAVFGGGSATGGGNSFGLGLRDVQFSATGQTATFTTTGVTRVDLHWTAVSGGGTVSYAISGGTTVSATNIVTSGTQQGQRTTLATGLTPATSYTFTITWVSGTSHVNGFMLYNGDETAGIQLWEGGHSGFAAASFNFNSAYWGTTVQNYCQPALCIIEVGTNDWGTAVGQATSAAHKASLTTLIATIRSRCVVPPSIVLMPVYERQAAATPLEPWANYVNAQRALAAADGDIAVFDLYKRLGTINTAGTNSRSILADLIHPTPRGHQLIADMLLDWLAGIWALPQLA